jgi:hypothetical protein
MERIFHQIRLNVFLKVVGSWGNSRVILKTGCVWAYKEKALSQRLPRKSDSILILAVSVLVSELEQLLLNLS